MGVRISFLRISSFLIIAMGITWLIGIILTPFLQVYEFKYPFRDIARAVF